MPVGVLQLDIHLPDAASLKDRRRLVRSLKDRLRQRFNLSVAELADDAVVWQRATVGLAAISSDRVYLRGVLTRAGDAALAILRGQEVSLGEIEIVD